MTLLQDYQSRLGNILEVDSKQRLFIVTKRVPFPAFSANVATTNIKLHEFYDLPGCGIKSLIAERNTSLGKLHTPSQRLLYDLRLLDMLDECLTATSAQEKEKLLNLIQVKQQDLEVSWNALIADSNDIENSIVNPTVYLEAGNSYRASVLAWRSLQNIKQDIARQKYHSQSIEQLEQELKLILDDALVARQRNTFSLIAQVLPEITAMLIKHAAPLTCNHPKQRQQIDYLRNVFDLFFVQQLQPLASSGNRLFYELQPVLQAIYKGTEPQLYAVAVEQQQAAFDAYSSAMSEHIQFWQALFKRCNINVS